MRTRFLLFAAAAAALGVPSSALGEDLRPSDAQLARHGGRILHFSDCGLKIEVVHDAATGALTIHSIDQTVILDSAPIVVWVESRDVGAAGSIPNVPTAGFRTEGQLPPANVPMNPPQLAGGNGCPKAAPQGAPVPAPAWGQPLPQGHPGFHPGFQPQGGVHQPGLQQPGFQPQGGNQPGFQQPGYQPQGGNQPGFQQPGTQPQGGMNQPSGGQPHLSQPYGQPAAPARPSSMGHPGMHGRDLGASASAAGSLQFVRVEDGGWRAIDASLRAPRGPMRIRLLSNGRVCETTLDLSAGAIAPGGAVSRGHIVTVEGGPRFEVVRDPVLATWTFRALDERIEGRDVLIENPQVVIGSGATARTFTLEPVPGQLRTWRLAGLEQNLANRDLDGTLRFQLNGRTLESRVNVSDTGTTTDANRQPATETSPSTQPSGTQPAPDTAPGTGDSGAQPDTGATAPTPAPSPSEDERTGSDTTAR